MVIGTYRETLVFYFQTTYYKFMSLFQKSQVFSSVFANSVVIVKGTIDTNERYTKTEFYWPNLIQPVTVKRKFHEFI